MIRDPLQEVLEVALRTPDHAGPGDLDPADVAALRLARRRFGVALPPPYIPPPADPARLPIRPGTGVDGPALAAVQRRAHRARYRGLLSDAFLDGLDLGYLGGYWTGRAAASPSARHHLLVAGRPGEAYGMVDTGPTRDGDGDVDGGGTPRTGEVCSVYVDPTVTGRGLGSALLGHAVATLAAHGFTGAVLWVVEGNVRARAFYERWGWRPDGSRKVTPIDAEHVDEVRYRLDRLDRLPGPGRAPGV
ncbi:MAG TPA: GNAT family N-acetyltransferase [Acidimicrobiales bacterium]|nr:GNAT family N-acetyltransferase [Acidimicrobiales bacterium]